MTVLYLVGAAVFLFAILAGVLALLLVAAWPVIALARCLFPPGSSREATASLAPSRRRKPRGLSLRC